MSSLPSTFNVKLHPPDTSNPRSVRRILLNAGVLKTAKIFAGDVLLLVSEDDPEAYCVGIAWPNSDIDAQTISISRSLSLTAHLVEGSKIRVSPLAATAKQDASLPATKDIIAASQIQLTELDPTLPETKAEKSTIGREWLVLAVRELLVDLRFITPSQILEVPYESRLRRLQVSSPVDSAPLASTDVEDGMEKLALSKSKYQILSVNWDTQVHIQTPETVAPKPEIQPQTLSSDYQDVGGLDKQIEQVRDLIEIPLSQPQLFRQFGLKPPRGILLHGPPGTGKTHLARSIATSSRTSLLAISGPELSSAYHGETEQKLREVFADAKRRSPCIIVIDEVDALCPKREDTGGGVEGRVVATLLTLMDGIDAKEDGAEDIRVVVVATTNRPNAIDPALRRPGRFDREIEIGVPDATARLSILQVLLSKIPHNLTLSELSTVANSTHGYVGADLAAVVRTAGTAAIKRSFTSPPALLTLVDLQLACTTHHPSALREHAVETPTTRWSDIGGQASIREKLKQSVEWPLIHPEAFARLGVTPPKGVLLYGPPGCSKTLTARALASESGINFIAVKGPELLNKYVGESERAVREIFRKARAAAPSIIFFDEIDGLATSRNGFGESHDGVLTSLLNEMDGIQELVGVTVVAATNRPDVMDPALMRPGRLDRILYVGPPDRQARKEILGIRLRGMAVDPALDVDELADLTDGCSGAELVSVCQDAALSAMQEDINASFVATKHFQVAAKGMRRQITPGMIQSFEEWRDSAGVRSA